MTSRSTVLLLTPNWRWDGSPLPVDTLTPPVAPPLEWAYLSARAPTGTIAIIDSFAKNHSIEELKEAITEIQPHYIVISTAPSLLFWRCPPMTIDAVKIAVSAINEIGRFIVILIGPHATHSPRWSLRTTGAEYAFRGAPEQCLVPQLLSNTLEQSPYIASLEHAARISILRGSDVESGSFSLFNLHEGYQPHMWNVTHVERSSLSINGRSALIEASRGCPWSCSYCAKSPTRSSYSRRSILAIERELTELKNMGVDYLFFIDETFNIASPHLNALLSLVKENGFRFGFQGRADLITPQSAELFARSGCVYVELGVDVVSSPLSDQINRRQSFQRATAGVAYAKETIPIVRFNRLNFTTKDYTEIFGDTSSNTWEYPPDPIYPYPGAPLGDIVMRRYNRNGFDWEFAEQYSWWLRLEVYLQRHFQDMSSFDVDRFQKQFLCLPRQAAAVVVSFIEPAKSDPQFATSNKYIKGVGHEIRLRNSSTK